MEETEREELRALIHQATRKDGGISAAELARRAGVSENTISDFMSGKRVPHRGTAEKLRRAMGEPPIADRLDQAPDVVKMVQQVVAVWLLGKPPEERQEAAFALVRFMAEPADPTRLTEGGLRHLVSTSR